MFNDNFDIYHQLEHFEYIWDDPDIKREICWGFIHLITNETNCDRQFLSYLQTDEQFTSLNLKIWILGIFKAALASQMQPSCPYKPVSF